MATQAELLAKTIDASGTEGVANNVDMGVQKSLFVSEYHGRLYELSYRKKIFMAHAIVTAPVIYTTAAGTGGPLIWNGSTTVNAVLLKVGFGVSTVSTVAAALGITGNSGQTAAPTSTTAIDSSKSLFVGSNQASLCSVYRVGTPSSAGNFFFPFADLHTGALTTNVGAMNWVDLEGGIIVPPNSWASVAASATATTTVASIGLIWAEIPV